MRFCISILLLLYIFCFSSFISGQGWVKKTVGTSSDLHSVYFSSSDIGYTVGQFGVIFKTTDSGESWVEQTSSVNTDLNSVYFIDDSTGYAVGDVGVILNTADGGSNWLAQTSGTTENLFEVQFVDGTGYIAKEVSGGDLEGILKTSNGGSLWERIDVGEFANLYALYFTSPAVGYTAGSGFITGSTPIFKTSNGGTDWVIQDSKTSALIRALFFPSSDTGYVCGSFSYTARTTNGGTDWTVMSLPIDGGYNSIFFTSNDVGYIAGQFESGNLPLIMKTTDAGDTWVEQVQTEVGILNSIFFVNPDVGFACGRVGLMLKTTSGGITSIETNDDPFYEFDLKQNYPNPFNPSTKIKFTIPNVERPAYRTGRFAESLSNNNERIGNSLYNTTLKVYDVLGNEIITLVNEELQSGSYEVNFNATDLTSGIYFYTIQASEFIETKKMILIK